MSADTEPAEAPIVELPVSRESDAVVMLSPLRTDGEPRAHVRIGYSEDGRIWFYWTGLDGHRRCVEIVGERLALVVGS